MTSFATTTGTTEQPAIATVNFADARPDLNGDPFANGRAAHDLIVETKGLTKRFGLDDGQSRTLEEVGQAFGVTRERIRQVEAKVIQKLQRAKAEGRGHASEE